MMEGNLALGGEHTMEYTYDVLLDCTLETYKILTNVTLINVIKKQTKNLDLMLIHYQFM